jgi:hypothetical protein
MNETTVLLIINVIISPSSFFSSIFFLNNNIIFVIILLKKVDSNVVSTSEEVDSQPKTLETTFIETEKSNRLSFNDTDYARDEHNNEVSIEAPKDFDRLEQISVERNAQRRLETENDDDGDSRLKIMDEDVQLGNLDIHNIEEPDINLIPDLLLDDIEVLA